ALADVTVACGAIPATSTIPFSNGLSGGCEVSGTSVTSSFTATPDACGGTVTETWTATDTCGRALASVSRTITVSPATLPTMTAPAATTVACGSIPAPSTISFNNGLSGGCLISGTSNPSTFTATPSSCGGTVTETWTATDICGRALASVSRTITVSPATLPTMTALADVTVACGAIPVTSTIPFSNGLSGGCEVSGTSVTSSFTATPDACGGTVTETWTATDICGRALASVSRTITVSPAALPTMTALADVTVACGAIPVTSTIPFSNGLSGGCEVSGTSVTSSFTATPDACGGTVTETWTATDTCGRALASVSRTITVSPATLPTMTAPAATTVACGSIPAPSTISFSNGLSGGCLISGTSNPSTFTTTPSSCGGTVTETWTATDTCGRALASVSRTITVSPATLPTMIALASITVAYGEIPASSTILFSNGLSGGSLISGISNTSTFTATPGACGGTVTETWTATDACGRPLAAVSRIITVSPAAISGSGAVTSNYNGSQLSCATATDGKITVTASYGTGTLTYAIDGGSYQASNIFTSLAAGTHSISVKDVSGCVKSLTSVIITAPIAVTIISVVKTSYNGSDLSCSTATDGKITVTGSGGTGTLMYSKNNGSTYQSSNVFSGLSVGTYQIKVRDANLCASSTMTVTIIAPTTLLATITSNNPTLYYGYTGDQTATITAKPTGGQAPYRVEIMMVDPLPTSPSRPIERVGGKLICGYINATGNESWTCTGTAYQTINSCGVQAKSISCNPSSTINNNIPLSGSYSVNVTLLADARFIAMVVDANGCSYTIPYNQSVGVDAEDARCFAGNSGVVKVALCHQTGSTKNPCTAICVDQSAVQEHLNHGDFLGKCTSNCKAPVLNAKLSVPDKIVVASTDVKSTELVMVDSYSLAHHNETIIEPAEFTVRVYPNPSDNQFTLVLEGGSDEKVEVLVYDMLARRVKRIEKNGGLPIVFGEEFTSGEYLVLVKQGANAKALNLIKK
ncbi:T9SS type A sorting domain-containing protein, partial [Flavobacterium sp. ZT3R18]|uniref:T9SS type A sorting domain-containing protein n=1 Tax=Flavobacterium sp. ZT3R18 TaxID=2594429 RepID=UPI00117AF0D8